MSGMPKLINKDLHLFLRGELRTDGWKSQWRKDLENAISKHSNVEIFKAKLERKNQTDMAHKILRLPAVQAMTGKSRTQIYSDMNRKLFPQSVPIGERAVGWLESDIEQWLEDRVKQRDKEIQADEARKGSSR